MAQYSKKCIWSKGLTIIFLSYPGTKLGLMCLAQGHNEVMPVRSEPVAAQSGVKH